MTCIMVLKVTKFREYRLNRFEIFSKNPQGGHFTPFPSQNWVKDVHNRNAIMVCEVKFGVKILPVYSPLNINNNINWEKIQACM